MFCRQLRLKTSIHTQTHRPSLPPRLPPSLRIRHSQPPLPSLASFLSPSLSPHERDAQRPAHSRSRTSACTAVPATVADTSADARHSTLRRDGECSSAHEAPRKPARCVGTASWCIECAAVHATSRGGKQHVHKYQHTHDQCLRGRRQSSPHCTRWTRAPGPTRTVTYSDQRTERETQTATRSTAHTHTRTHTHTHSRTTVAENRTPASSKHAATRVPGRKRRGGAHDGEAEECACRLHRLYDLEVAVMSSWV
jgi:hypothetical protein